MLLVIAAVAAVSSTFRCKNGTIPHSNVTAMSPCVGVDGDACYFQCNAGYLAIGRHVCQSYTTKKGRKVIHKEFFGGRCERLCKEEPSTCSDGFIAVRNNVTSGNKNAPCFATVCLPEDEALKRLARGSYAVWRKARLSTTGIYSGWTQD